MKIRGKIWSIENPADGVYQIVLVRKAKNQTLHAVFTLLGRKWEEEISNLAINEMVEVQYVIRAKEYTDRNGVRRWSNSLIVNKLIYAREAREYQTNMHKHFNAC
jgi:hypothetical protein